MAVTFRGDEVRQELQQAVGRELLRIALTVQAAGQRKMGTSNQGGAAPSKPGEWLRRGTGHGIGGLVYEPATPAAIAAAGAVRVGWRQNSFYMALWGDVRKSRKGLIDLVSELRPQLAALQGGGA